MSTTTISNLLTHGVTLNTITSSNDHFISNVACTKSCHKSISMNTITNSIMTSEQILPTLSSSIMLIDLTSSLKDFIISDKSSSKLDNYHQSQAQTTLSVITTTTTKNWISDDAMTSSSFTQEWSQYYNYSNIKSSKLNNNIASTMLTSSISILTMSNINIPILSSYDATTTTVATTIYTDTKFVLTSTIHQDTFSLLSIQDSKTDYIERQSTLDTNWHRKENSSTSIQESSILTTSITINSTTTLIPQIATRLIFVYQ